MTSRYSERCFTVKAQKLWLSERQTDKHSKVSAERNRNSESASESGVKEGSKANEYLALVNEAYDKFVEDVKVSKATKLTNSQGSKRRQINGTFLPASCRYEDHRYSRAQSAARGAPLAVHAVGYHADQNNNAKTRLRSRSHNYANRDATKADTRPVSSSKSEPVYQTVRLSSSLTNLSEISIAKDLNSVLHVSHCQLSSRWAINAGAFTRLKETLKKRRARTALPDANRAKLELNTDHFTLQQCGQSQASASLVKRSSSPGESPAQRETTSGCNSPDVATSGDGPSTSSEEYEAKDKDFCLDSREDTSPVPTAELVDFSESTVYKDGLKKRPRSVGFCRSCDKDFSNTTEKQYHPQEISDKFRRFLRPTLAAETLPQMVVYQWEAEQTTSGRPKARRRSHTAPAPTLQRLYKRVIEIDLRGIPRCTSSERMPSTPPASPRTAYQDPAWAEGINSWKQ